jgi:hypothetical protein
MFDGVALVYELDGEDGCLRVKWYGLFDPARAVSDVLRAGNAMLTYEAYAPRPMVLEIILKGRSLGSGSSCDCDMLS